MSDIKLTEEQEEEIQNEDSVTPSSKGMSENPSEFVQKLLENSHIPKHLVNRYWALTGQTIKLTWFTEEEANVMMYRWDIIKTTIIESIPKQAFDEQMEFDLEQMEIEFISNLNRSKGNGSGLNERIALLSSNSQSTYSEKTLDNTESGWWGSSILKKLRGK